jgi:putative transposase
LGRSRGGLSTKIHAAGDGLGNPIRLIGTPGQRNDIAFAHDLIDGLTADVTIADKGYDADHLIEKVAYFADGEQQFRTIMSAEFRRS